MPREILFKIISYLKCEYLLPGDVILEQSTPGNAMFIIDSGSVAVYSKDGQEVNFKLINQFLDWSNRWCIFLI